MVGFEKMYLQKFKHLMSELSYKFIYWMINSMNLHE